MNKKAITVRRLTGLTLSVLVIWAVGAWFCDSQVPLVWSDELRLNIHEPQGQAFWRSEGRGTTRFGRYGVAGIPDLASRKGPRIYLWGDSFVEALQVPDECKMANILDRKLFTGDRAPGVVAGFGHSGEMLADYYFRIPAVDKVCGTAAVHVVVFADMDDTLPDRPTADRAKFVSDPEFRFVEAPKVGVMGPRARFLMETRAFFVHALKRNIQPARLRFTLGPPEKSAATEPSRPLTEAEMRRAWRFALTRLKAQSPGRLVMLYVPEVPRLVGRSISLDDPDARVAVEFESICHELGVEYLNASDAQMNYFQLKGRLPRGFPNSRPGSGHLNREGHEVIADFLAGYLKDGIYAVHAD